MRVGIISPWRAWIEQNGEEGSFTPSPFSCLTAWAGTFHLIFSDPRTRIYIISSSGSWAFRPELGCATGFPGSPAYGLGDFSASVIVWANSSYWIYMMYLYITLVLLLSRTLANTGVAVIMVAMATEPCIQLSPMAMCGSLSGLGHCVSHGDVSLLNPNCQSPSFSSDCNPATHKPRIPPFALSSLLFPKPRLLLKNVTEMCQPSWHIRPRMQPTIVGVTWCPWDTVLTITPLRRSFPLLFYPIRVTEKSFPVPQVSGKVQDSS